MSPTRTTSNGPAVSLTPAMRQYFDAKRQHQDALLLFRMGDFYELFYDDALTAARVLDITLTSRSRDSHGNAIPMCGVPVHAFDTYLTRLVRKGFRVAVCEQVEDPRSAKGVVRREVVRVVSPGTLTDAAYLDAREPAFLTSLVKIRTGDQDVWGCAFVDLSTGEFTTSEYASRDDLKELTDHISVLSPREILISSDTELPPAIAAVLGVGVPLTRIEPSSFDLARARRALSEQLETQGVTGFGLDNHPAATSAAGALVFHLRETQKVELAHVRTLTFRQTADHLILDPITLKHLEVVEGTDGGRAGSVLDEIDRTVTVMGGRLMRSWLIRPLVSLDPIRDRLDAVEESAFRASDRGRLREGLRAVQDLERLVSRAALGTASPRDLQGLAQSLACVPRLKQLLTAFQAPMIAEVAAALDDLPALRGLLETTLADDLPATARDGGVIRDGVDPPLDELRSVSRSGKQVIAQMEERERARTGITSLKIRYNRVFGYYIEISKSNLHAVPDDYQRKQTIAGGERYITPALKEYEERVLGADERILEREVELFETLRRQVAASASPIKKTAAALATLDAVTALAETAAVSNYVKPHVDGGDELVMIDARHPVVERTSPEPFVSNDLTLNPTSAQLIILTGPNMGGKSTYLRQTAVICLMAQAGSFVPAREARLGLVDRIFARVGASDNIARGQSTFMIEMQETANILHNATSQSLVILDEVGRGTATFDGLSIAWAVAEHLATNARARPKTLFATHYHELTDLADALPGIQNAHVAARERQDSIVFLRKVVPGRSDRSYGIQVARLAGLPKPVIARAREILVALERDELSRGGRPALSGTPSEPQLQFGLFQPGPADEPLAERLRAVDPDRLTPLEALTLLAELKRDAK